MLESAKDKPAEIQFNLGAWQRTQEQCGHNGVTYVRYSSLPLTSDTTTGSQGTDESAPKSGEDKTLNIDAVETICRAGKDVTHVCMDYECTSPTFHSLTSMILYLSSPR